MSGVTNTQPESVREALLILYASLGVGVVRSAIEFPRLIERSAAVGGAGFAVFVGVFTIAILWLNIFLIGKRYNWARYLFLVLFVLGVPLSIKPLIESLSTTPISGSLGLLQAIAQAVGLVLLFKTSSGVWFKKQTRDGQISD